jgi:hypothetical protein
MSVRPHPGASSTSEPSKDFERGSSRSTPTSRIVWVALIVLGGLFVGSAAALLAYAGGAVVPNAILLGGTGFTGTVLLLLTLVRFLAGTSE